MGIAAALAKKPEEGTGNKKQHTKVFALVHRHQFPLKSKQELFVTLMFLQQQNLSLSHQN